MEKMNLYQKLLHIQKEVDSFIKDTEGHNYSYVSGNQVLGKIRPLMNDLGLLLKPEITSIDNERMDYKTKYGEKSEILSKVMFRMTWVDCDSGDMDVNLWGANGQNDWDKGVGSAMTYAERYFLLKYFHVPTDVDDVDDKKKSEEQTTTQPKAQPTEIYEMTIKDVEKWNGKIYGKNTVYVNGDKKSISEEQINKLKAHPNYKPDNK